MMSFKLSAHFRNALIVFFLFCLTGCSILNPYEEEFACRPGEKTGGCFDVRSAYAHAKSTEGNDTIDVDPPVLPEDRKMMRDSTNIDSKSLYRESVYSELKKLVDKDVTPMLSPPVILKTSFIPFTDEDGVLFMGDDVFEMVEEPKFVLDGRLSSPDDQ